MYEAIIALLESMANHPWVTLGIVILLFHLERGYNLIRYVLIPHYKFTRLMYVQVLTSGEKCREIYNLSRSGIQNKHSTKKAILSKNIDLSLPLAELRILINDMGLPLFEKKLYDLAKRFLQRIEGQYEYILLHEKCPSSVIKPEKLEQWIKDISNHVPRTFWESTGAHFRINFYHFKRKKDLRRLSSIKDSPDGLFAFSQAMMLKMFFLPRSDVPQHTKMIVKNYIKGIEEAYRKKDEPLCVELFKTMSGFLRENNDILKVKEG